jgi:hypothetical protein
MRQRNEKRSKRQRMSKRRRRTIKKQRGGRIWQINVHSADNILIETITVYDEKKSFAENGITGNDTTKYYATLSSDVEIDYNSIPLYPEGNNPLIIYQKDV